LSTLFFYGTLRHVPLLEIVLGRLLTATDIETAELPGHVVHQVVDQDFPVIRPGDGTAHGIVLHNVSELEVERLRFYEGGFDYSLKPCSAETQNGTIPAEVFFPIPDRWEFGDAWDLAKWVSDWAGLTCLAAQELMTYFGRRSASEIDFMFPMVRSRAAAKLYAAHQPPAANPGGFTRADAETLDVDRAFARYFSLEEHTLRFRRYDGSHTEMVKREVFVATDATILLPYDPVRDRVLLIEQFRPGPFVRMDDQPWILEPIAGRVDPGETPEETAHREAMEEAGLVLKDLHEVARCYASPGCTTEYYHVFVGEADLPDDVTGVAGMEDEAEDIKSYLYSYDDLMEMVDQKQAANAPLVLAALWLSRHRDHLRSMA
jgi:nudix-type nucleoside diphosphatase (YffH/AdpP family)